MRWDTRPARARPEEELLAPPSPLWRPRVVIAVLVLLSAALYLPHVNSPWMYDDVSLIEGNVHVRHIGDIAQFLSSYYWNNEHGGTAGVYRPLREMVFTVLYAVAPKDPGTGVPVPWSFGLLSFLIHLAVLLILYAVGRRLFTNPVAPAVAALLFAVHPVHVEAVLWRKNLGELLCGLFVVGGFWCFVRWLERLRAGRRGWGFFAGGVACYVLGLLSKEMALALPFVVLVYALATVKRDLRRRALVLIGIVFLVGFAYVAFQVTAFRLVPAALHGMRSEASPLESGTTGPEANADEALAMRPALVAKTLVVYQRLLLWPLQLSAKQHFYFPESYMALDLVHELNRLPTIFEQWTPWYLLGFAIMVGLMGWGIYAWPRGAYLILWAMVFLAPVSNIIPFRGRPIGEQRLYVPSLGFCLLVGATAGLVSTMRRRRPARRVGTACLVAALAISVFLTVDRARTVDDWRTFWRDLLIKSPIQASTHVVGWGRYYFDRGLFEQALAHSQLALHYESNNIDALMLDGLVWGELKEPGNAIDDFRQVLRLDPNRKNAWRNLGVACLQTGADVEAADALNRALTLVPGDIDARLHLAMALLHLKRDKDALAQVGEVLAVDLARYPRAPTVRVLTQTAEEMMKAGQRPTAAALLQRALQLAPGYAPAQALLRQAGG